MQLNLLKMNDGTSNRQIIINTRRYIVMNQTKKFLLLILFISLSGCISTGMSNPADIVTSHSSLQGFFFLEKAFQGKIVFSAL